MPRLHHLALLAVSLCGTTSAAVTVPSVIGDHMVLQHSSDVAIWGWASPGEVVRVSASWRDTGPLANVTAGTDGSWRTTIATPVAGGPYTLTISGENTITLDDVLVGEVWVCAGQSNMEWPVAQADNAGEEIAAANHPEIRLFTVPNRFSEREQADSQGAWSVCSSDTVASFSAVGYHFGRELNAELDVPIGLVSSDFGGTVAEAWTSERVLREIPGLAGAARRRPGEPPLHKNTPAALYNGMIAPIIPFTIRGVIWYQGESNRLEARQYRSLFPALIENWRQDWGLGDFPFYFVQIAPFAYAGDRGEAARLREAQLMALASSNTGMVVTTDIGNPRDIHPRNKREVGRRLSLWALAHDYGRPVPAFSGPLYSGMTIDGSEIRIGFTHVGDGLVARSGPLTHFNIAGNDREFVPARARIDGNSVIVSSDRVAAPVAVRFGWGAADEPNLFNAHGLPASTFRTDDW